MAYMPVGSDLSMAWIHSTTRKRNKMRTDLLARLLITVLSIGFELSVLYYRTQLEWQFGVCCEDKTNHPSRTMQAVMSIACCNPTVCAVVSVSDVGGSQRTGIRVQRISAAPAMLNTRSSRLSVKAQPTEQELTFNYEGQKTTVFPAEACDELGEEYCGVEGVGQEVKPKAQAKSEGKASSEAGVDREYEDYKGEKTVFPGEACDELGGAFCEPEYQKGVFPEKK